MATHCIILAWRIPWTEEPDGLWSFGPQRVGQNWCNFFKRFVIAFLPRSKCLLISWRQSPSAVILEPKKTVCHCFHCFPIYLPWSNGQMPWSLFFECWALSQLFSISFVTLIRRLFTSCLLSAIRVVSSAYHRLLIFFLAILIPGCASSSPAFHKMYSACKLNKQSDNIQSWHTPSPVLNQSVVLCQF